VARTQRSTMPAEVRKKAMQKSNKCDIAYVHSRSRIWTTQVLYEKFSRNDVRSSA